MRQEFTRNAAAASAMSGKRVVQSMPLRVSSRTPAASRRTIMRKPSCLISCSHVSLHGGLLARLLRSPLDPPTEEDSIQTVPIDLEADERFDWVTGRAEAS